MSAALEYRQCLEAEARARYDAKTAAVGQDPYRLCPPELKPMKDCQPKELPDLSYPDIYHYLLSVPGYSGKVLKPYRSLEAYKYFAAGRVRSVMVSAKDDKFVVVSKVTHEDRLLDVWVICQSDGVVIAGHCTCLTGLDEACSHVAAALFAVDAWVRVQQETCTPVPPSCVSPPYSQTAVLSNDEGSGPAAAASAEESSAFYQSVARSSPRNLVLSVMPEYCEQFKRSVSPGMPAPLTELYSEDNAKLSLPELLESCADTFLNMILTPDQARLVEAETRGKSDSKQWTGQRAGRIPASRLKSACRADHTNPPEILIMAVCYPEMVPGYPKTTGWGCVHQSTAKTVYEQLHNLNHQQGVIRNDGGLIVNPLYPHMAAAPDGYVSCACCGDGLVEIKCSVCAKTLSDPNDAMVSFLTPDHAGACKLKIDHAHYYQIQALLHITERKFCDLVVWRTGAVDMERIGPDEPFWIRCVEESSKFYVHGVLPELLSKWFSRGGQDADRGAEPPYAICYCRRLAEGAVIECENARCKVRKFHVHCLGLKNTPKAMWRCLGCKRLAKVQRHSPT